MKNNSTATYNFKSLNRSENNFKKIFLNLVGLHFLKCKPGNMDWFIYNRNAGLREDSFFTCIFKISFAVLLMTCFFVYTNSYCQRVQTPGSGLGSDYLSEYYSSVYLDTIAKKFGSSVADAGDLNGYGVNDFVIGAVETNSSRGKIKVYAGETMTMVPLFSKNGDSPNDQFGFAVSGAGDVNNDNYDDFMASAVGFNSRRGRVYFFYGKIFPDSNINNTITGLSPGEAFGSSLAHCDINNDGYPDLLIGAPSANSGTGKCYVYFGGMQLDTIPDLILTGETPGSLFGISVASAGDVNKDGYDDIIIGASGYQINTGRAYIYYGSANPDDISDVILNGGFPSGNFGCSVSSAGDVNGDIYKDVIVGEKNFMAKGRINIFHGGAFMDNAVDFKTNISDSSKLLGSTVALLGDANRDGYSDIIAGAPGQSGSKGVVYILYGGAVMDTIPDIIMRGQENGDLLGSSLATGYLRFSNGPNALIGVPGAKLTVLGNKYDGEVLLASDLFIKPVKLLGGASSPNGFLGNSVSKAGDVNGDGYADMIAGLSGYNSFTGRAYIYFGGSAYDTIPDVTFNGLISNSQFGYSVSDAGDVNNDGFGDVIVSYGNGSSNGAYIYYGGNPMNNIPDVNIMLPSTSDAKNSLVRSAGDINGDGYDDVLAGNELTGLVKVYFGGNPMNNVLDLTFTKESNGTGFGYSFSKAGDINDDGYSDVIIGAYNHNLRGKVYLYFGGAVPDNVPDRVFHGDSLGRNLGRSVSYAGDVNGDGIDDFVFSGSNLNAMGKVYLHFGSTAADTVADVISPGRYFEYGFGYNICGAGDINNDGYDDVAIAIYNNNEASFKFLYGGLDINPFASGQYINPSDNIVRDITLSSISFTGDLDNDGYDELIMGWPKSQSNRGLVDVFESSNILIPFINKTTDIKNDNGNKIYLSASIFPSILVSQYVLERSPVPSGSGFNWTPIKVYEPSESYFIDTLATPDNTKYYYRLVSYLNDPSLVYYSAPVEGQSFVNINPVQLSLRFFIEGFYNNSTDSQTGDTITVLIKNSTAPYNNVDSTTAFTDANGNAALTFPALSNGSYYIAVKHRNSITTWSSSPVTLNNMVPASYDFSDNSAKAFGNNQKNVDSSPQTFAIYSGDVVRDGLVNLNDITAIYNAAVLFTNGYQTTDITGDNITNLNDITLAYNNSNSFVMMIAP